MYAHDWHITFAESVRSLNSESLTKLKRHNKKVKKHNTNKDFRGGERRLYRHHELSQQDGE